MTDVLGLSPLMSFAGSEGSDGDAEHRALDALVRSLVDQRAQARAQREWARADELRDQLAAAGVRVEDGPEGSTWSV